MKGRVYKPSKRRLLNTTHLLLDDQESTEYYTFLTKSYNIPEFVKGKVKTDTYKLVSRIKEGKNQQISFTK